MARSDFLTWLPLDEFAKIIGIGPLGWNQLFSNTLPRNNVCGEIFFQQDWQHSDRVGRDTIAMAIQEAEQQIAQEVGYNLIPDWTVAERLPFPRPSNPEAYNIYGVNTRWDMKSIELTKGHVLYGGVKAKTLIQRGATFVRSDADVDGYQELCTLDVVTTVTDVNEIRLYYPAKDGDDAWEIRPIKVTISGGSARIIFNAWQVVAANQQDSFDANVLDADAPATYETTVDVYRVYNDPSTQVQFLWESTSNCCSDASCVACQLSTQAGCFHIRDEELGFVVPAPATWDASDQAFDAAEYSACREPDQIRFWYRSGYIDQRLARPYVDMAPYWKKAVAYFAASKFERAVCGCSNVNQFIEKWRRDGAFSSINEGGFSLTPEQASNRLGTSMGALHAYRLIHQNGIKVNK